MMPLTDEQIEQIADAAARKALGEMFELFGVDVSTAKERRAFAEDLSFLRVARTGSSRFRAATITTIGGSLVTGIGYLAWKGLIALGILVK